MGGTTVHRGSKLQLNVALSGGEVELNSDVKGFLEVPGLY